MTSGSRLPSSRQPSRICLCHGPFQICKLPFSPSILVLEEKETHFDLEQMARPISEAHHCLIGPQDPGRCHCLHCPTTNLAVHPVPSPPFLSPASRLFQAYLPKPSLLLTGKRSLVCPSKKVVHQEHSGTPSCFILLPEDFLVTQQFIIEAGWCREPKHSPLDYARDFKVILQGFQNFLLPGKLLLHPHVLVKGIVTHTQLIASIIDLNLKILKFCMCFCPLHTTAFV